MLDLADVLWPHQPPHLGPTLGCPPQKRPGPVHSLFRYFPLGCVLSCLLVHIIHCRWSVLLLRVKYAHRSLYRACGFSITCLSGGLGWHLTKCEVSEVILNFPFNFSPPHLGWLQVPKTLRSYPGYWELLTVAPDLNRTSIGSTFFSKLTPLKLTCSLSPSLSMSYHTGKQTNTFVFFKQQ